jgi:hypothetical protein
MTLDDTAPGLIQVYEFTPYRHLIKQKPMEGIRLWDVIHIIQIAMIASQDYVTLSTRIADKKKLCWPQV